MIWDSMIWYAILIQQHWLLELDTERQLRAVQMKPPWACLSLPAWAVSVAAWAKRVYKQHFGCMRTCEVQLSHCSTTSGNRGVPLELVGPLERPSMIQELAGKEFWLEANLGSWQAIPLKSRHLLNSEAKDFYGNGHKTSYVMLILILIKFLISIVNGI